MNVAHVIDPNTKWSSNNSQTHHTCERCVLSECMSPYISVAFNAFSLHFALSYVSYEFSKAKLPTMLHLYASAFECFWLSWQSETTPHISSSRHLAVH